MSTLSPFQDMRWESDEENIIWLPPEFSEWESKRSVYITGSRGTGKTTLLKGLEWKQRLINKSLKNQLGSNPFERRCIGVYLNMPNFVSKHFINWPPKIEELDDLTWEEEKARVYSLYLEYQILQLFTKAIQGLKILDFLKFSPHQELKTINEILVERPEIRFFLEENEKAGLNDLRLCFKRMHENIRFCAINKIPLQPTAGYPCLQMGQMLEEVAGILLRLCSMEEGEEEKLDRDNRWTFKVCIDQTESPETYQQKAINTMIARQETGEVSFAIASLEGVDIESTYIPRHPLTDADREHYPLEKVYRDLKKYRQFIEAVTELRFKKFTGNEGISVNLKEILGEWDINALLYPALKRSEKEKVKSFIRRSEENKGVKLFEFKRKETSLDVLEENTLYRSEDEITIPPFYQTYLTEKLEIKLPHDRTDQGEIRAQKSKEIRKKMVAAMLCMCKEFSFDVPYAGYNMVISMSDRCIRDFLRQMHYIYLEEGDTPTKFMQNNIHPNKQDSAIHKASEKKFSGISNELTYNSSEVMRLINALGVITSKIQSAFNDPLALKNTERGRFEIDFSQMKQTNAKELQKILGLARDSLYIKTIGDFYSYKDNKKILFRLHRLFAPKFEFSYRGAYYNVSIKGDVLLKICYAEDEQLVSNLIDNIFSEITNPESSKRNKQSILTLDNWIDNL